MAGLVIPAAHVLLVLVPGWVSVGRVWCGSGLSLMFTMSRAVHILVLGVSMVVVSAVDVHGSSGLPHAVASGPLLVPAAGRTPATAMPPRMRVGGLRVFPGSYLNNLLPLLNFHRIKY